MVCVCGRGITMEHSRGPWNLWVVMVVVVAVVTPAVHCSWQDGWDPVSTLNMMEDGSVRRFKDKDPKKGDFRLLLAEDDSMLVAARNSLYNISMVTLNKNSEIEWSPEKSHIDICQKRQKSKTECQNYIRVMVKKSPDTLFMCGTNAFKPTCRTYSQTPNGTYLNRKEESGVAICPFDPAQNSTAIYADGKLYSATVSDFNSRDSLILAQTNLTRTVQFDSKWLNEPNFISSMEKEDKVYFFFRETAVENINCGKAVFSRVARVCKHDTGGSILLKNIFTSFFKARLNCSIPGDFPFYFDEIQSTTEMGKGNYRPTYDSGDRTDMVYAIFNTPLNSIRGSAVCAFRYSDIIRTFEGPFKGQDSSRHNWLAVQWKDRRKDGFARHPQECMNDSRSLPDTTLNFIKTHPLMNEAVPASGGGPLLIHTSFKGQFTKIAVDWMVRAADERYYDVIFVGTYDGRVIKSVNKGATSSIDTVVIEDIQVFGKHDPVTDLRVYRDKAKGIEKLIVVSKENVVSIPLYRCHTRKTCRTCVELRDPYCSWDGAQCVNAERGTQNVIDGWEQDCEEVTIYDDSEEEEEKEDKKKVEVVEVVETQMTTPEVQTEKCSCPTVTSNKDDDAPVVGPRVGQSSEQTPVPPPVATASVETLVIAIVLSIVLSMLVGFLIGYKVAGCRSANNSDASYMERTCSLQRSRNRLSSGEHPYYNPDHAMMPKQMNYVVNVKGKLNTGHVETKPVTKSNKVYL
ncbi:semaphorin-1A-like isoform X2 [Babylonia areolata]|uniref:semaphorin-1A-like isoform X2 n=1 Tax=Babylonia areolata TaxID=304850 RepID=UPI003FD50F65